MMLAVKLFSRSMWTRTHERRELEGRMMGIIHQALTAIPAVQAFTREDLEHAASASAPMEPSRLISAG